MKVHRLNALWDVFRIWGNVSVRELGNVSQLAVGLVKRISRMKKAIHFVSCVTEPDLDFIFSGL